MQAGGLLCERKGGKRLMVFGGEDACVMAVLLDDVQHPAAELLGFLRTGEHPEQMRAAQAEYAHFLSAARTLHFNQRSHAVGKFFSMAAVEVAHPRYKGGRSLRPPFAGRVKRRRNVVYGQPFVALRSITLRLVPPNIRFAMFNSFEE